MNMKHNYFEDIDSLEKAYWLGFLYADGCVTKNGIKLSLSAKDEHIIDNFCKVLDVSLGRKKYYSRKLNDKYFSCADLFVPSQQLTSDLIKLGCVPGKSRIEISLPTLSTQEYYLSFLVGLFDGDGSSGTSALCCGSKNFLLEIKEKFNIPFKLRLKINPKGQCYEINLGMPLLRQAHHVHQGLLPRKVPKIIPIKIKNEKPDPNPNWRIQDRIYAREFNPTREELHNLVWSMPTTYVAKHFGVSDKAIEKRCRRLDIDKPPRGYWAKENSKK